MVSEKNGKENNLRLYFWELPDKLLIKIWYKYCIDSEYLTILPQLWSLRIENGYPLYSV